MDAQLKKGVLEICVLALLVQRDCYGYELVGQVSRLVEISEGTIYPMLKRLESEGYLDHYVKESSGGAIRKYYRITEGGIEYFTIKKQEWFKLYTPINELLKGGKAIE